MDSSIKSFAKNAEMYERAGGSVEGRGRKLVRPVSLKGNMRELCEA